MWFLLLTISPWSAASDTNGRLTVSGTGEIQLVPDQAELRLTIALRGAELAVLQKNTNDAVSLMIEELTALDIALSDIESTQISIQPVFRYDQASKKRMSEGYEVNRTITVLLRELELLSAVMTAATDQGINQISPPRLSSSQHEDAYRQALAREVAQARARADAIAQAAEIRITGVDAISAGDYRSSPVPMARVAMAADSESNSFQPGEMAVTANVTVTYFIQP